MFVRTGNILLITMLGLCWQSATSWSMPLILSLKSFEPSRPEICLMYSVLSAILCVWDLQLLWLLDSLWMTHQTAQYKYKAKHVGIKSLEAALLYCLISTLTCWSDWVALCWETRLWPYRCLEGSVCPWPTECLGAFHQDPKSPKNVQVRGQYKLVASQWAHTNTTNTFVLRVKTVSLTVCRSLVGIYFSRILSKSGWEDRESSIRRPKYLLGGAAWVRH